MKHFAIAVLLFVATASIAQPSVNNYQYVIVPSKFEFSRSKDEFRLNSLVKFLLQKYGFKALLDTDPQPDEIVDSNCKKLYADLDSKGFMTTKVRIILKDCKNKVLYTSDEGISREKLISKAYDIAIRQAFESFPELHYKYDPSGLDAQNKKAATGETAVINEDFNGEMLSAQPAGNGFNLVDSTSKIIIQLFKTSSSDRFTAVKGDIHGELLSKNGQWHFEHYENDHLVSEHINVKF